MPDQAPDKRRPSLIREAAVRRTAPASLLHLPQCLDNEAQRKGGVAGGAVRVTPREGLRPVIREGRPGPPPRAHRRRGRDLAAAPAHRPHRPALPAPRRSAGADGRRGRHGLASEMRPGTVAAKQPGIGRTTECDREALGRRPSATVRPAYDFGYASPFRAALTKLNAEAPELPVRHIATRVARASHERMHVLAPLRFTGPSLSAMMHRIVMRKHPADGR